MFDKAWLASPIHRVQVWAHHLAQPMLVGRLNYEVSARRTLFEWTEQAIAQDLRLSPLVLPAVTGVWSSAQQRNLPQDFEGLPGLLNDALPDGWGRYLMDKAIARQQVDPRFISPAARLAFIADRAWGALSFKPAMESAAEGEISLDALGHEVEAAIDGALADVSRALLTAGSSPQGARPKIMLDLDASMRRARVTTGIPPAGFSSWLIKFAARDEPVDAPVLEQAYMECAREAGLDVMDSCLLDINGKPAFATRRFDRMGQRRTHCHTLGGMIHFSHREIGLDYVNIAEVMARLGVPDSDYLQAYTRAVFNAAMSVRDDHAKNFAFILDGRQRWAISPAYDLTCMEGPGGYHTLAFAGGSSRDPVRADLLRLADSYRIEPAQASGIIDGMLSLAPRFGAIAKQLGARAAVIDPIVRRLAGIGRALA
ncbi:putative DNA-binding transcriptional regulator [Bordetella ansorpii]|uniref:Putative DNA-binding transcriptional regulator n=1 Tax=Bordetella ansorpii TaxID=288768 RepID=A0A157SMI3_9BORD|nr:type II toxin-antitoxin system HipA family toxin [Bordetella ansorpii]SAI71689.1 putative DNA-binding transcriptional regulator [Bordetella ansorpii]